MELVFFFFKVKIVDTTHVDRSQRQLSHSFEGFPAAFLSKKTPC